MPDCAPAAWQERSALWNSVEEAEKTKDSRLARVFVVALPVELDKDTWQELLSYFIRAQFVSDGMYADAAIHDTDASPCPYHTDGSPADGSRRMAAQDGEGVSLRP